MLDQKKAAAARAEKMAGQLKKEVRLLQEALADNNIIIDKVGRMTSRPASSPTVRCSTAPLPWQVLNLLCAEGNSTRCSSQLPRPDPVHVLTLHSIAIACPTQPGRLPGLPAAHPRRVHRHQGAQRGPAGTRRGHPLTAPGTRAAGKAGGCLDRRRSRPDLHPNSLAAAVTVDGLLQFSLCTCCCRAAALQVDTQIAQIQSAQEQRLNSMLPSARQAYSDLMSEQASLLAEAGRFEEEGAELSAALAAAEGELSRNGFKQRVLEVQVRVAAAEAPKTPWLLVSVSSRVLPSLCQALQGDCGSAAAVLTRQSTPVSCVVSAVQEQVRVLTQRKVELAAAEEAAKASPDDQKEVHTMVAL